VEVARRSGLVSRRNNLHRRDLQGRREADLHQGRRLDDPSGLFNASLDGNTRRAIDLREGDEIDAKAFKALVREAVALNTSACRSKKRPWRATLGASAPRRGVEAETT